MTEADMIRRTKQFALRVLRLVDALPRTRAGNIIANQLGRCATSVGANYRAACHGRSKADFCAKLGIVEEEADECVYWLELIMEGELLKASRIQPLHLEANEFVAIMVASRKTAATGIRSNRKSKIKSQNS